MSEMPPVLFPFASSNEATNCVPAANGRNVMAAPVAVSLSQSESGMGIETIWVLLRGTTFNVIGRAEGGSPPENEMLKGPHWST